MKKLKSNNYLNIGAFIAASSLFWIPVNIIAMIVQYVIGIALMLYSIHLVSKE